MAYRGLTPTATEFRRCAAGVYNGEMFWTFSLGRIMHVITLTGVVFGIAVNLPDGFWQALILLIPSLVPAIALAYFSRCRSLLLFFAVLGLLYGVTAWPMLGRSPFCCGFEDGDAFRFFMLFFLPGLFATAAAGCYLHVERCLLRLNSSQHGSAAARLGDNV